jgi:cytochrome c-type biogenesis protein CcmH/NrfG
MALSMDEQRILAEIEQHLARAEPALAARLAAFGHPVEVSTLRSAKARILASFALLVIVAVVSVVVYALIPLRTPDRGGTGRATPAPGHPSMSAPHQPATSRPASPSAAGQHPSLTASAR